jgi:hypothetical protein
MDILRELNEQELGFIVEKFKQQLPYAIKNLQYIESAIKCKKYVLNNRNIDISEKILPTFYTHRYGLKENCTIFGITGERNHTVWYFTFDESLKEIKECLEMTQLIKWHLRILFVTIHVEQIHPIIDCAQKHGLKIPEIDYCSYFWISPKEALQFDIG